MLLQRFPGKLLEELDQVNWPRLMRALAAEDVERVEQVRELHRANKAKPTVAEWKRIKSHDAWWKQWKREHAGDDDDVGDDDDEDDDDVEVE